MQLLTHWSLNLIVTALLVSGSVSLLASVITHRLHKASTSNPSFSALFFAAFAFSLLGFVTGELMGDSRESVVGTVIPAALTLLGGMAAYIVTSKGVREQAATSGILICFTFCLLVGSTLGIRLRVEYETELQDPARLGQQAVALQHNKLAVDLRRLQDFVMFTHFRDEFAQSDKIDLSGFKSSLEAPSSTEQPPTVPEKSSP